MDGTCKIWTYRGEQIGMGIEMGVFFLSSEQTLTSFLYHKARNDHHRGNVLVTVNLERQ